MDTKVTRLSRYTKDVLVMFLNIEQTGGKGGKSKRSGDPAMLRSHIAGGGKAEGRNNSIPLSNQ